VCEAAETGEGECTEAKHEEEYLDEGVGLHTAAEEFGGISFYFERAGDGAVGEDAEQAGGEQRDP